MLLTFNDASLLCSYIVPEYSFLDARGLGAYEGKKLDSISQVRFEKMSSHFKHVNDETIGNHKNFG